MIRVAKETHNGAGRMFDTHRVTPLSVLDSAVDGDGSTAWNCDRGTVACAFACAARQARPQRA